MENYKKLAESVGKGGKVIEDLGKAPGIAGKGMVLMGALPLIVAISSVDFKAIKGEVKNLTPEQRAEVNKAFDDSLDITNDKLEKVLEEVADIAVAGRQMIESVVGLFKHIKELKQLAIQA